MSRARWRGLPCKAALSDLLLANDLDSGSGSGLMDTKVQQPHLRSQGACASDARPHGGPHAPCWGDRLGRS